MADEDEEGNSSSTFTSEESSSDSESCSTDSDDPMFIVEKIIDHHSYGHLKRRHMIDSGRPQADFELFFLVRWEGYASDEDSWEPWETLEKLNVFKDYIRKHHIHSKALSRGAEPFSEDAVGDHRRNSAKHWKCCDDRKRQRYNTGVSSFVESRKKKHSNSFIVKNTSDAIASAPSSTEEKRECTNTSPKRRTRKRTSIEREKKREERIRALKKIVEKRRKLGDQKQIEVMNYALHSSSDDTVPKRGPLKIFISSDDEVADSAMVTPTSEREEEPPILKPHVPSNSGLREEYLGNSVIEDSESGDESDRMFIDVDCDSPESQQVEELDADKNESYATLCRREYVVELADGFLEYKRRTRSVSPIVERFIKSGILSNRKETERSRDDLYFREYSSRVKLLKHSELKIIAERFLEGKQTIRSLRNLSPNERHSIADRLRNASVQKFQRIIGECISKGNRIAAVKCDLRRFLITRNLHDFLVKWHCMECDILGNDAFSDTFDWVLHDVCLKNANHISPFGDLLCRGACSTVHNVCRLIRHIFSRVSVTLRQRLFDELRDRNGNAALAQAVSLAAINGDPCILDVLLHFGANINSGRISALQKCVDNGCRELVIYLLRKGADPCRLKYFDDVNFFDRSSDAIRYANPLLWHLVRFINRLNSSFANWTSSSLKQELSDELTIFPISAVHPFRIGQLDKRVFVRVVSRDDRNVASTEIHPDNVLATMLVIHACHFPDANDIASLHLEKRPIVATLPDILRIRLGAACDEVDLRLVVHTSDMLVYQFPEYCKLEAATIRICTRMLL
uniref:ANK_REP_REGION domain-containing protein n=1 Tax=Parascaris univalens TaxID=6257 RepID=A0A914ZII9_PARUN